MPQYVVVLRGPSGVRISIDKPPLRILKFPCHTGTVDLTIRTYLSDEGYEVALPRGIWIDARGEAPSLHEAETSFWTAAQSTLSLLALTTNADVGPLEAELAYDNTPDIARREFLQRFLPNERGIPPQGRRCDLTATIALLEAISIHQEQERLLRAVVQYHLALSHWRAGHETLCLAHLFMGMEALTVSALRLHCAQQGKTELELARSWEIQTDRNQWRAELLTETRRRLLFQRDEITHKAAKSASDGLEHGFMKFEEVNTAAQAARDKTGYYLRTAILEMSGVNQQARESLQSEPFRNPLETWKPKKLVRGFILGSAAHLGPQDKEYPMLKWESSIKSVTREASGEYLFTPNEHFTVHFAEGLSFEPSSVEIWGPPKDKISTHP